jgi:drug/metabolite transporter (DMT)-like permease
VQKISTLDSKTGLANWGLLIFLAAIWGGSFLFIRIAAPVMGSLFLMGVRMVISTVAVWGYARSMRVPTDFRARWKEYLLLGALNNAIPFVLIANAVIDLNASVSAILNATTPLFTALAATVWVGESFGKRRALGLLAGLGGVALLVGFSPIPFSGRVVWAAAQSLLAALSYGLGAVYSRRRFRTSPPLVTSLGQFVGSTLLLLPLALWAFPTGPVSAAAWLAAATLALLGTAFAYLLYFRLITSAGSTGTTSVTFLVPFFSILWGALFLTEPLNAAMFAGLGVILMSVWLVMG